jgi:hypothetical protein
MIIFSKKQWTVNLKVFYFVWFWSFSFWPLPPFYVHISFRVNKQRWTNPLLFHRLLLSIKRCHEVVAVSVLHGTISAIVHLMRSIWYTDSSEVVQFRLSLYWQIRYYIFVFNVCGDGWNWTQDVYNSRKVYKIDINGNIAQSDNLYLTILIVPLEVNSFD